MPFRGRCSLCGELKQVSVNRQLNDNCCNTCYVKRFQPHYTCAGCGWVGPMRWVVDPDEGTRLCKTCYASQIHLATCSHCGARNARIHHRKRDGKVICIECYHQHYQRARRADRDGPTKHQRDSLVDMHAIAAERGGWCLAEAYEDSQTNMRWRCRHGHEWEATAAAVKYGTWCAACAGIARGTMKQMHALAAENGGVCLSAHYEGGGKPLQWRCVRGHEFTAPPAQIRQGTWCAECAGTRRLTIEEMHALARERGGACLSDAYVNSREHLRWRCAEGHEWSATPGSIKNLRSWCPTCAGGVKPVLAELQAHARGRGGRLLATKYRSGKDPLRWRCGERHEWDAPWDRIRGGAWCPECARERMRLPKPRKTLADMHAYAALFGGQCLAEYYVNSTTKIQWRCAMGHEFEAVPSSVKAGHWCPECAGVRRGSLDDLRALARARGGECLSREYHGVMTDYRWRCAEGHEWVALGNRVRRGSWCPHCAGRLRLTIEEMQSLARERGGLCLSTVYVNSQTHLRWRCAEGHEWEAVPSSVKLGRWCRLCMVEARVARTATARASRL